MFIRLIFLFLSMCHLQSTEWYSEYWQKLFWSMWENDSFEVSTFVRMDSDNHMRGCRGGQISEQFAWKVSDDLRFELHYTYLHAYSIAPPSPWRWQNRIEIEANRTFHPSCYFEIRTRNRLEIRRLEKNPKTDYRFRQQTTVYVPIENAGCLKAYSLYNEVFYDISTSEFSQDRFYPIQLTFTLSEKVDFEAFFMLRFFLHDSLWNRSAVLGTQFLF